MGKAAGTEGEKKSSRVKEVSVSINEFRAKQLAGTVGIKGQVEHAFIMPDMIPRVIKPNHPLGFLLFDKETPLYRPGGNAELGFKRYDFAGGEIVTDTGNKIVVPQLLKLHLIDPEPLNPHHHYKVKAGNRVQHRNVPYKLSANEKAIKAEVLQFLELKYKFENERVINRWKEGVFKTLGRLLDMPDVIDAPVLCVYPATSKFLTRLLETLGAQQVESITFNGQKLLTASLTGTTKSADYISSSPKLLPNNKASENRDLAIMVLPAGPNLDLEKVKAFVASELVRLSEQFESLPARRSEHRRGGKAILERIRTEPRLRDYISLIEANAEDAIPHRRGIIERISQMFE